MLYWEYHRIASAYKGFALDEIKNMSVRERDYWTRMAKHA